MSDTKRTVADIQRDYTEACAKLGHLTYSKFALEKDSKSLLEVMLDLNLEGAAAQKREAEAPKLESVES